MSVLALASRALPQSAPAESAAKTAAATASTTLTKEERTRAIDYLKQTQKDFLAALEGVSEEQWKFKAAPERWSIAEAAEHIAVTEETIWHLVKDKIMKSPAAPEKRAEVAGKDELIPRVIEDRSRKAQAPEQLKPTGRFATRDELVKHFLDTRRQEIAYLNDTTDDLRDHFFDHPLLKTMDGYQWLLLNGAHGKRHTLQILEVKTDANYPKS
jgi:hypothetical protein